MNRILIVEDEPRLASFLEKGLRANGFTTTTVHDGFEATVLAHDADFDLMVLDLGLPGKDGLSVLRDVRAARQPDAGGDPQRARRHRRQGRRASSAAPTTT